MTSRHLLDGRLKLRHLLLVDALSEWGSTVRAAQSLHVTQPVVTRGLQELEGILGVTLFERTTRGLRPTVFAEAFTVHARNVIAQLNQAGTHIAELASGRRGSVTVGVHLIGSNMLLPGAISTFKADHPLATVVVRNSTPEELYAELLTGQVDMIVGRLYPQREPERVTERPLYDEPLRLITRRGHPLQSAQSLTLAGLIKQLWIVPVAGTSLRPEMEELLLREGLSLPNNRVECTSFLVMRQVLLQTDAVALLPVLVAMEDPRLAPLQLPMHSLPSTVGVTTEAWRTLSPAAQALLSHLELAVGNLDHVLNGLAASGAD